MARRIGARPVLGLLLIVALAQAACGIGSTPVAPAAVEPPATLAPVQPGGVAPAEHGTADEAKAMLAKAVERYNQVGRDPALKDFNAGQAPFLDRDLYVVCLSADHLETANGGFPQYVGVSGDLLLDSDGNPLGKTVWEKATATDVGSVNYKWTDPVTGQTEPKTLYFQKVGTDVCGVGVYSP